MDKDQFYKDAESFFNENLMYEIYSSDELIICNLANACYVVFSEINTRYGHCGILIDQDQAKRIAEKNSYFGNVLKSIKKEDLTNNMIVLNENSLAITRKLKEKYAQEGQITDINYEMEQELMQMSKKRGGR